MKTIIRKMGNLQGALVLRMPRRGWAEASKALAESGQDKLVWPGFANQEDAKLKW